MENSINNICFIISHKYYRNYTSYIQYYVDNIQKFYPNSLCIIVDNNSTYIEDIILKFKDYKNVIILLNISLCKFELGAYKFGISYLIENNLLNNYDYIIFSQDTFVLKNKYDFNNMKKENIQALSFGCSDEGNLHGTYDGISVFNKIYERTNLSNKINKLTICWCCSFILDTSKVQTFLDITKDIIITTRQESEYSERYFDAILFYLNNNKRFSFNNVNSENLSYNCHTIDLINDNVKEFFAKKAQQKTEYSI